LITARPARTARSASSSRARVSEIDDDLVAQEFADEAVVLGDHSLDAVLIDGHDGEQIFGVLGR
jgi:hypothetical protein